MEEKGADPLGDAAERLALNSRAFIAALLPGAHSIAALVGERTCTNLHHPLLLQSHCMHGPEYGASGGLKLMGIFCLWAETTDREEGASSFICLSLRQQALGLSFSSSYSDLFKEMEDHYG